MSFYRNVVWYVKGLQEYTQSGFLSAAKHFEAKDLDVDLRGKTYLITGANSGLGKQTALEIAKRGGTVHMVCRNPKTAEEAKNEIQSSAALGAEVHLHILDMSELKDVGDFTEEFAKSIGRLDCLVNNAGCMINSREVTAEGMEKNFATNTVGTHILTRGLIRLIEKSSDPRVITVSSGGMLTQKLNLGDLQSEKMSPFDGTMVYAQNKRQQVVMTRKYAQTHQNIFFASMHPGWTDTPAVRSSMPEFYAKMKDKLRSVDQGADTIVWLAVSEVAKKEESGGFFQDRKHVSEHLPLAFTKASREDEEKLMKILDDFAQEQIQR